MDSQVFVPSLTLSLFILLAFTPNVVVEWLSFLFIKEVPGSNLSSETDCHD
jgi:hypothetical protein